jgi:hypothetical protein
MKPTCLAWMIALAMSATAMGMPVDSAVDDFNKATNTDGQRWTYRYANDLVRDGDYALLDTFGQLQSMSPKLDIWVLGNIPYPGVGVNDTGVAAQWLGNQFAFSFPDAHVFLHPGNLGLAVLTWQSPFAGVVGIDLTVWDVDPNGGDGVNWYLDRGDSTGNIAGGTVINNSTGPMQYNVAVGVGDKIHLVIDPRGSYQFDTTAVTMNITVPEPTSAAMFAGVGLAAMATRRRLG